LVTLDNNNNNNAVPLWTKDSVKAAELAQQYGLTAVGHLYRAYDPKAKLAPS
jgi:hypothetical protein